MAYYAVRGVRPSEFLKYGRLEKIFLLAAMEADIERENQKVEVLAKVAGLKFKK